MVGIWLLTAILIAFATATEAEEKKGKPIRIHRHHHSSSSSSNEMRRLCPWQIPAPRPPKPCHRHCSSSDRKSSYSDSSSSSSSSSCKRSSSSYHRSSSSSSKMSSSSSSSRKQSSSSSQTQIEQDLVYEYIAPCNARQLTVDVAGSGCSRLRIYDKGHKIYDSASDRAPSYLAEGYHSLHLRYTDGKGGKKVYPAISNLRGGCPDNAIRTCTTIGRFTVCACASRYIE